MSVFATHTRTAMRVHGDLVEAVGLSDEAECTSLADVAVTIRCSLVDDGFS